MSLSGQQTVLTQQLGSNAVDTLDYLAFWKTFDMAAAAAFSGKDAAFLRRDPKFVDMGTWTDGWPVRRLSADMPKVEGEEPPARGPRRRL
jgi:allantoicase